MRLVHSPLELREILACEHQIAFVPTMGNLHAGHLALIELAAAHGRPVVASVFVNPLQFGAGEDFERYPRTLEEDCRQLEEAGCDLVFAPTAAAMYPEPQTFRVVPPLADQLCGATRPGHFDGVCTVVLKLFEIVRPRVAVFGRKDFQQLFLIRAMARQFNLAIDIVEAPTVRAADGMALSSRNAYLTAAERAEAPRLHDELRRIATTLRQRAQSPAALEQAAADRLAQHGWIVDYISVRSRATLLPPAPQETALVVLGAARLGGTRLIDNLDCEA